MILRNVCNYDIQGEGSPSIVSTVERTKTNRRRKKRLIHSFYLQVSPRYVTLYFTGSFALDAAIVVGGLPRPNWREQALSRADTSIRSGSVDVIVADRALEYKMGDAHMIIQAATCLELQSMVVLKRKGSPRRGDSADEESKRNSASDGPAKAKRPRCEK
ncbi:unnamed protein product [Brassica oleracea var. botrytis]